MQTDDYVHLNDDGFSAGFVIDSYNMVVLMKNIENNPCGKGLMRRHMLNEFARPSPHSIQTPGFYSLCNSTSIHYATRLTIARSRKVSQPSNKVVDMIAIPWNLTSVSAALIPKRQSNVRAIGSLGSFSSHILWRDFFVYLWLSE